MKNNHSIALSKLALGIAFALSSLTVMPTLAQTTTSAIAGRITSSDGKPASGAQVSILHLESGSTTNTTADAEGRYSARGLRVGGPYTITITKVW
jgi:hypothetical protein